MEEERGQQQQSGGTFMLSHIENHEQWTKNVRGCHSFHTAKRTKTDKGFFGIFESDQRALHNDIV